MKSVFGWSYPPGCSGPPDEEYGPCEVCGLDPNDCICPECPVCGLMGRDQCYIDHGLTKTAEQIASLKKAMEAL